MLSPDSVSGFSQVSAGSARAKARAHALSRPELQGPILTAIGYFIAAKVGAALAFPAAPVSAFWAPNAILFAALLLAPTRTWWRYLAAVLPLHVLAQIASTPPEQIVIQYLANAAEALIGATALIRYEKRPIRLDTLRATSNFILIGGFAAPFVTSLFMVGAFVGVGLTSDAWLTVIARTITNTFAIITLVPLIVHGIDSLRRRPKPALHRALEAMLVAGGLILVCLYVFVSPDAHSERGSALLYAPLPILILATVRFGLMGVCGSVLILGGLATWGVLHGTGPFVSHSPVQNALATVAFLNVTCVPLLLLASVLEERKRATLALEQNQRLHQAVMASLRDEIAVLDSHGRILEANASWLAAIECNGSRGQQVGRNYLDAVSEAAARGDPASIALRDALLAVLQGTETRRDVELSCSDGQEERWFEHSIEALKHPAHGAVITRSDVTARKRAEIEVEEQRQQLAHLGRAAIIGELSGAIAHEIRQPLTIMMASAETAISLLSTHTIDREALEEALDDVISANVRAAKVIQRVQSMLRSTAEARSRLLLNEIIKESLVFAQADLIRRHIAVVLQLHEPSPTVNADRVQIQQVILNLLSNACDAMAGVPEPRREITIASRLAANDEVVISVSDCGTGIPQNQLESIFEPFVTSKQHGFGLGLSICRTIIAAHGGKLWAENLETGAAFHFTLRSECASPAA